MQTIDDETHIVNDGSSVTVTSVGELFGVQRDDQDIAQLVVTGHRVQGSTVAIENQLERNCPVGVGDSHGVSYLTMTINPTETAAFTFDAEFAVVPVRRERQSRSKLVTGSVLKKWFSFKLSDVTADDPSFTFNGEDIVNSSGINTISPHDSWEVVFGNGSNLAKET
ncbi:hypothetical protein BGZ82_002876, partial [Podila clonocystis]